MDRRDPCSTGFQPVPRCAAGHGLKTRATWALLIFTFLLKASADELPTEWVDPDTGHRVVRLSREDGSASLYFHQNAYTPDGKKLIITTPTGISTIDLATRQIEPIVEGKVAPLVTGRKSGR